jgi:hypothetical protein
LYFIFSRTDGCEDIIPTWGSRRRNLYEVAKRICCEGKEGASMEAEKVFVWFKTITKDVVSKILYLYVGT